MSKVTPHAGPYDSFIGELTPGLFGWLPLDEAGLPIGPATLLPPAPDSPACRVYATVSPPPGHDALVTASGAPLTSHMNSNVDRRFNPVYS